MNRINGKICLVLAFTLAGTSVISARFVTGKLGPFTITAVSLLFALMFLVPLCLKQLVSCIRVISFRNLLFLALQALFGIFLFRLLLLSGLRYTSAGEAGILTGATPAITALLAMSILREPASFKKLGGVIVAVAGILIIQGLLIPGNSLTMEHIGGNILVLCAAASESVFNIMSRIPAVKNTADRSRYGSPVAQTAIVSAIAFALCLVPALLEHPFKELLKIGVWEWAALIWYGVFVTALAFIFWYSGIKRCDGFTAAAFSGLMPFTSMLLSTALLGESVGWQQWSGGAFVVAGMILIESDGIAGALFRKIKKKRNGCKYNGYL